MPIPRRIAYPVIGMSAAFALAVGLLIVRLTPGGIGWAAMREEVAADLATYLYLTIAAMTVLVGLGALLGLQTDRLLTLSATDALTGLDNRRALEGRLDDEISRSARCGQPLSVLLVDLDKFKDVNDRCGHLTGDVLLCSVGHAIQGTLRRTDRGARLGGDEFALLAPDTDRAAAAILAERVRAAIVSEARRLRQPVTASIGISTFNPQGWQSVDRLSLMNAADLALYEAKHGGGNGIKLAARA
jgi:diguanylate cyclase (GGDEF)-like protein